MHLKEIEVDLKPGDMLIYSGCELEHLERTISKASYVVKYSYTIIMQMDALQSLICMIKDHCWVYPKLVDSQRTLI